jgi:hypothetical protein
MGKPEVTCSADVVELYSASSRLIQLGATATESPTSWEWTILDLPDGSTANIGVKGDFTDGVATVQNPQLEIDGGIDGAYILQCVATNNEPLSSNPLKDKENGQQWILVRSERWQQYYPGDKGYNYGKRYLNKTLRKLEEPHGSTHENGQDDEIDVTGLSGELADPQPPKAHGSDHGAGQGDEISLTGLSGESATPQPPKTHGSSHGNGQADEISVAGLSGLLADPQTPTGHASSHGDGQSDEISVTGLSGELSDPQIPKAHKSDHELGGSDEITHQNLQDAGTNDHSAIDSHLGASAPHSGHEETANKNAANGYAGLDASSKLTGSQQVYGTGSDTACEGDDSRLSDARIPTSHALSHEDAGSDELTVQNLGSGAASINKILETDGSGGWNLIDTPSGGGASTLESMTDTPSGYGSNGQVLKTNGSDAFTYDTLDNSDVGLGNVTNDAQLKRADNDWSGFTEESSPGSTDLILLEKVTTGAKRKVQVGNLPGGGGGDTPHEEVWTSTASGTPGVIVLKGDTALSATPRGGGTADTPSGYDLRVFCEGIMMKYVSGTPAATNEYTYNDGTNKVSVYGSGEADFYQIVYGS